MTLAEYFKVLEHHDWFYEYSDDHSVWSRGSERERHLKLIARESPEHQDLYNRFRAYYFSGPTWGTERAPKPEEVK